MRLKHYAYGLAIAAPLVISAMSAQRPDAASNKLLTKLNTIPDSIFEEVTQEDLLIDEVYIKLARDGWSQEEIRKIMGNYIRKNRKQVRGSYEYGRYAKQWLPTYGYTPGGDSIYQFIDTTYNATAFRLVRAAVGKSYDDYYKAEPYTPDDRKKGIRQPGIFRPVLHKPSSGRIHWIHVHPENDDSLMVIPDGGGIFRTHDAGRNWDCITDRIPAREHRNVATHSAIPVDPDDWNHVFAFMNNGNPVYESTNGGESWRRVEGATHKSFKRGYCFRDAAGTLKFIGAVQNGGNRYWSSRLYISEDTCKTWTEVIVPDSLKDIHPLDPNIRGNWFQQVEFDPNDRDRIYMPTSRSILYFDDGAKSHEENGRKTYRLKKMAFKVFNQDSTILRSDTTVFPFHGSSQGFLNVNPNNPNQMWFAAGQRNPLQTAVYYSSDKGKNWITLQEPSAGIGAGRAFGNEAPWGWLGGFGVNYTDPNWLYGCSMSSAISSDGGHTFNEFAWGHRMKALLEDGQYHHASNSRHNADNHCIVSHKSGRVFRGSDGGMLMKDKNINNHEWTNIGGNMGQMLYYGVNTNEFGDQLIFGNTQDIDAQTYRYGRWGHWRGYEGSTSFTNPYSNTCYFSGGGGGGIEDIDFGSWSPGYTQADVCTGSWYLRRADRGMMSFYRIDDVGRSVTDLAQTIGSRVDYFTLARDKGRCTVFALSADKKVRRSVDNGNTFEILFSTSTDGSAIAADPDNSDILYLAEKGTVWRYNLTDNSREAVGSGLPKVHCHFLYFHEGSGDMYYCARGQGVFIKEKSASEWRLWMKGFNTTDYNGIVINYTTQEMVISDYGRGVFVADLQNPAERFFPNGFALKELSHVNGRRTLGIDTKWTIPLYYYYEWSVNDSVRNNPYQYLTDSLRPGDRVQLKLTLRESPDVSNLSDVYIVTESPSNKPATKPGNAVYSNGAGMIDLGYVDYFFNDFTIDMWVKPQSNGVILCNRQKEWDKGAKGWHLSMENESLRFRYAPANMFSLPTYETSFTQQTELNAGSVQLNQWHHIAVTHQRNGKIVMYVDGMPKAEGERILPEHTLNNAMNLGLFADGYERVMMEGCADELKIWNYALSADEVRRSMFAFGGNKDAGLVYYNSFNEGSLSDNRETFSAVSPRIRQRAQSESVSMPVYISAEKAATAQLADSVRFFAAEAHSLLVSAKSATFNPDLHAYRYHAQQLLEVPSNIDTTYYEVLSPAFQLKAFETIAKGSDTVSLTFKAGTIAAYNDYRIYTAEVYSDKKYWSELGQLSVDEAESSLTLKETTLSALQQKILLLVRLKPAIETRIPHMSASGKLFIYENGISETVMDARLLAELDEPFSAYRLISDHEVLQPAAALYFTKGKASGKLRLNSIHAGNFGESTPVTLRGEDKRMIPVPLDVVNKITPTEAGQSTHIVKGGMVIGSAGDYTPMHMSNHISMMTWVRLDSADLFSGLRPLMMFRGGGSSTGLHLESGNIRCHWNEEGWSWSTSTSLNVTADYQGKWVHLAMIARPDGIDFYLNGTKATIRRNLNPTRILSPFMLGQNQAGNTWFNGAFDHAAAWNRSLTQDEVIHYMHNRIPLNDSALVAYVTMDHRNAKGELCELVSGSKITCYGTVQTQYRSPAPFEAEATYTSEGEAPVRFAETLSKWYLNSFAAYPYNWMPEVKSGYRPLKKAFYTFTFAENPAFTQTDSLGLTITDAAILADDSLYLALRPLGSEEGFAQYLPAKRIVDGEALFRIAPAQLTKGVEMMLFTAPDAQARPVIGAISLPQQTNERILLAEGTNHFEVNVKIESSNPDDKILLAVKESDYATPEKDTINVNRMGGRIAICIDREKLDKMAWNPVTLYLSGAQADPLQLMVALEPKVQLRLKNGNDDNHFTATSPISTLEVEAELTEGVMEENVLLHTTADMNNILNTGNGTLLTDRNVVFSSLEHHVSPSGQQHEGWNLIGNPYLANINLTKRQNVVFDEEKMSKFLYAYNPETQNYETSDMTQYDQTQQIMPFRSYFIQTLSTDAQLTITPIAKQTSINRRVFDYFTATERTALRLQLQNHVGINDRTDIVIDEAANEYFVINEDAPKLRSMSATANQLFSLTDGTEVSVNTQSRNVSTIPLGLVVGTPGEMKFTVGNLSGFGPGDLKLHDHLTGSTWIPEAGSAYEFSISAPGEYKERFTLQIERNITGIEPVHSYIVTVESGICTIHGLEYGATVGIYDIQGRMVNSADCKEDTYSAPLHPGSYLVKIVKQQKEYVTKIIVR